MTGQIKGTFSHGH